MGNEHGEISISFKHNVNFQAPTNIVKILICLDMLLVVLLENGCILITHAQQSSHFERVSITVKTLLVQRCLSNPVLDYKS